MTDDGIDATLTAGVDRRSDTGTGGRIAVHDLTVTFHDRDGSGTTALQDMELTVEPGQIVSIIGPNGCGKSTMLRVIAGLVRPARGDVLLDDDPIIGPDPRIGLVFQEPRLLPWRSVARNISYPAELAGIDRETRELRVDELLARVGLQAARDLLPSQLSGGMRQRAALARALALAPGVLLLDEPFSALDALTRERFNIELLKLWGRLRTTIVLVTHSIPEAIFLGDRVVVLSARPGRVVADIEVPFPRPRTIDVLDASAFSSTARLVRGRLEADE